MNPPHIQFQREIRSIVCKLYILFHDDFPLQRSISKFETMLEFLEACRDVVQALRSLYQGGKILHRDICIKNVVIASRRNEGDAKGVSIDLDMALNLEQGPARRAELTIGLLSGDPYIYLNELECLLYVFLWVAICDDYDYDYEESLRCQPKTSRL